MVLRGTQDTRSGYFRGMRVRGWVFKRMEIGLVGNVSQVNFWYGPVFRGWVGDCVEVEMMYHARGSTRTKDFYRSYSIESSIEG
jgi:hypothetical protein